MFNRKQVLFSKKERGHEIMSKRRERGGTGEGGKPSLAASAKSCLSQDRRGKNQQALRTLFQGRISFHQKKEGCPENGGEKELWWGKSSRQGLFEPECSAASPSRIKSEDKERGEKNRPEIWEKNARDSRLGARE